MMDHLDVPGSSHGGVGFSELLENEKGSVGIEIVDFETDNPYDQDTLGFRLNGSRSAGVFVKSIHCGSPADLVGKIHAGDQLLKVDEVGLSGLTPEQVVRILRAALSFSGRVKITVAHPWADRSHRSTSSMSPSLSDGHLAKKTVQSPVITRPKPKSATKKASVHEVEVHRNYSGRAKVSPEISANGLSSDADSVATICDVDDKLISFSEHATPIADNISPSVASRKSSVKNLLRAWDSDDNSLNVPKYEEEDEFKIHKPKPFSPDDIKQMVVNAPRKSFRKQISTEELPLVSFDQLSQKTPSPTETKRNDRGDSSQSKSSKSSNASKSSSQSQQLSWHCPVCLDGASRIRRTKRRMMSTVCGHVFCSRCVEDVINKYRMCPTCRTCLSNLSEVHPIFM